MGVYVFGLKHRQLRIDRLPALFWLSSYAASRHLAVAPQSSRKDQFHSTAYYINLNAICLAEIVSNFFKG